MSNDPHLELVDKEYKAWVFRMQDSTGQVRREYLSNKANWTPLMLHIHRFALTLGMVLGMIMGLIIGYGLLG